MMLVSHPRCQEYKKREDDRARRVEEVKTLSSQLNNLISQYQNAVAQANQAAQQANISCPLASTKGLGVINAMGCVAARTNYETNRLAAQSLAPQITQIQSQMTTAQSNFITLPPSVLPSGCRTDGTAIIVVPSSMRPTTSVASPVYAAAPGSSSVGQKVSTEPTVHDVVEKIRSVDHGPMPVAQRSGGVGVTGRTTMMIRNSTAYELSVFFDGPVSTKVTLAPGASQDVDLAPGMFHVAGRVSASDVLPFYGEETYEASARYSVRFYIGP
jgi:hypothetical protein